MPDPFFNLSDLGLSATSSSLIEQWIAQMQATIPGYAPSAASLEYIQAQVIATMAASLAQLCSIGSTELFRTFGVSLVGVQYLPAVSAEVLVNVTAQASEDPAASLSAPIASGVQITSLPVVALTYGLTANTSVTITDPTGGNPQTFTTSGASAGDTIIPISAATPGFDYPTTSPISGFQSYILSPLTQFSIDQLGFVNFQSFTIEAGNSQNVTLTAIGPGTVANGAGATGNVLPVQQIPWIDGLTVVSGGGASGGQDPEDTTHYLNRLKATLQLQGPHAVTAADFAAMALSFSPFPSTDQQEIGRATAVDGYNPVDNSFNNERMVTVAITDENGFALNADTLYGYPNGSSVNVVTTPPNPNAGWGVAGWLQSLRELGFIVNMISPTYSLIYVKATVKAASGWDATSVAQNVQTSLLGYLAPAVWGLPPSSPAGWQNSTTIFASAITSVIQQTPGVSAGGHVISVQFDTTNPPVNTADLALAGPIALPVSNTLSIPTSNITVT